MALINWTLVEQRRVGQGIPHSDLADITQITERRLYSFDDPHSDDSGLTLAQLKSLAQALDLKPAALLQPEQPEEELAAELRRYQDQPRPPHPVQTRFCGAAELPAEHERAAKGAPPARDAATLAAALQLLGEATDPGHLSNALDWPISRLEEAAASLVRSWRGSGLRVRSDHNGRWELTQARTALTPKQRAELRALAYGEPSAEAAAVLYQLHLDGPLRLDQINTRLQPEFHRLEQLRLIERHGAQYKTAAVITEVFELLDSFDRD